MQNGGSVFHTWRWRKVMESTGAKSLYLACRNSKGALLAVCPFFFEKAGYRLQLLDSLPIAHMGGPIIDYKTANVSTTMESLPKSVKFSISNPILSMVLRVHDPLIVKSLRGLGFGCDADTGLFILDLLEKAPQDIWNQGFHKHERQAVKFYEESDASFGLARHESEYTDFWSLYQESLQRKEAHPMSPDFLTALRLNFGEQFQVAVACFEGKTVAAQSLICDPRNSMIHFAMAGYSRSKNIHSPAVYLNWKTIAWASENAFRYINFGPASSDPKDLIHKFKSKFCGKPIIRYKFTLPTTAIPYLVARRISRALRGARRSVVSNNEE
jgi:hypothetical protein